MDSDGLNNDNYGYYPQPSLYKEVGLQLMLNSPGTKHYIPGRDHSVMVNANGFFHPVSEAPGPMSYVRNSWGNHNRDRFPNVLPATPNYPVLPETSGAHSLHILQPPTSSQDEIPVARVEEAPVKKEGGGKSKKRQSDSAPKTPKPKKPRKPKDNNVTVQRVKAPKKNIDLVINGIDMDISGIPIPVCSCTGAPHQCYRWGCGGWQSACCTTNISTYPLPMSDKRRGARIAGRKMSQGAFKKVLEKLAADGYNFSNPIDLKTHWARHGTNKFVTIR